MQKTSPDLLYEQRGKYTPSAQAFQANTAVPPSPTSDHSYIQTTPLAMAQEATDALPQTKSETDMSIMMDSQTGANKATNDLTNDLANDTATEIVTAIDVDELKAQHVADVAALTSLVLSDIVQKNDSRPFTSNELTRFHSRAPPQISIKDYIMRVVKFCKLEKAMLVVSLHFVDLFTKSYPNFVLNSLTVHRFLITAFTVAAKGLCDQFCSNTLYAKVGGLSVMELNLLEVEFLVRVHYRIVPPVTALSAKYQLIQDQAVSPSFHSIQSPSSVASSPPTIPSTVSPQPGRLNSEDAPKASLVSKATGTSSSTFHHISSDDRASIPAVPTKRSDPPDVHNLPNPPGKASGNKGLKAMKETFRFLHSSKKKRNEIN